MVDAIVGAAQGPKKSKEKKKVLDAVKDGKKKKKEKKKAVDVDVAPPATIAAPPLNTGASGVVPPQLGPVREQPFDVGVDGSLIPGGMPPGTTLQGAGLASGAVADTGLPPDIASSTPEELSAEGSFNPQQVQPYPEMGFLKKLGFGIAGAIPFANLAAYPFWKSHQDKVQRMQDQDERTGEWFFDALESQPQAAGKLISQPFIREALTRRYGIDTPEELEGLQEYSTNLGIPLKDAATALAQGKMVFAGPGGGAGSPGGADGSRDFGDVPTMETPLGMLQAAPQVLGANDQLVSPTGQTVQASQAAQQRKDFEDAYLSGNPGKHPIDAKLAYMYANKGQVQFDTTAGGNKVVITDRFGGEPTVIDGQSLQKGNISVQEIWDGNEFLGWLMIDKDDMTNKEIWLEDVMESMPEEQQTSMAEDLIGWARRELPPAFADVMETIWNAGGKVAGQRKGPPKPPKSATEKGTTEPKDIYDELLEGE